MLSYAHECWNFDRNLHFIPRCLPNCFLRISIHFHFWSYSNLRVDFLVFYHHSLYYVFSFIRVWNSFNLAREVYLFQDILLIRYSREGQMFWLVENHFCCFWFHSQSFILQVRYFELFFVKLFLINLSASTILNFFQFGATSFCIFQLAILGQNLWQ
jgi:hypothetical protein